MAGFRRRSVRYRPWRSEHPRGRLQPRRRSWRLRSGELHRRAQRHLSRLGRLHGERQHGRVSRRSEGKPRAEFGVFLPAAPRGGMRLLWQLQRRDRGGQPRPGHRCGGARLPLTGRFALVCMMQRPLRAWLIACWLLVASGGVQTFAYTTTPGDGGRGPGTVYVPNGYSPGTPVPLLLLLHGYSSSGPAVESYIGYLSLVDARGFAYAFPSGRVDSLGQRFWTATDACCNLFNLGGPNDDSNY